MSTLLRLSVRMFLATLACLGAALPAVADFPPGFLWGTAISGFQAETGGVPTNGDPASDWWVWTHDATNISAGRVSGQLPEGGPGFWNYFATDLETVRKRVKTNAFRMNIEWSRIFPASTAGVDTSGGITLADLE